MFFRNTIELRSHKGHSTEHPLELLKSARGPIAIVQWRTRTPHPYPHEPGVGHVRCFSLAAPTKQYKVRRCVRSVQRVRNDMATVKDALVAASPAPLVCLCPIDPKSTLALTPAPVINDL